MSQLPLLRLTSTSKKVFFFNKSKPKTVITLIQGYITKYNEQNNITILVVKENESIFLMVEKHFKAIKKRFFFNKSKPKR